MGCRSSSSVEEHHKDKTLLTSDLPTPLALQASSDDAERVSKEIEQLKRVAKVEEHRQAIVLLHGLHRLSYDFNAMQAVLKEKFPHATITALTSVDKDPSKKGSAYISPSMELSIEEQAKLAYKEIKTKIDRGKHIVIVGHSQGGLRGFTVVKEYGNQLKSQDGIIITQLITIGTPWRGAPVMDHIKNIKEFKQKFKEIETTLDKVAQDYSEAVIKYFFKFMPKLAKAWPSLYERAVPYLMRKKCPGAVDLHPKSDFIRHYVATGLRAVDLPITAIAGVLIDFSKLFEPFPSSIDPQALDTLNATYANLIGGDPKCEHDMLLPVGTQQAEGLAKQNFTCVKVYGACHGNKVGIKVKDGLAELNNKEVIQKVVGSIEAAFYEAKRKVLVAGEEQSVPAA